MKKLRHPYRICVLLWTLNAWLYFWTCIDHKLFLFCFRDSVAQWENNKRIEFVKRRLELCFVYIDDIRRGIWHISGQVEAQGKLFQAWRALSQWATRAHSSLYNFNEGIECMELINMLICEWFKWMDISSFARVGCVVLSDLGLYGGHSGYWTSNWKFSPLHFSLFPESDAWAMLFLVLQKIWQALLGNCNSAHEHVSQDASFLLLYCIMYSF